MADVADYKRSALGCVLDLSAPYLDYLRAVEAEEQTWENEQHRVMLAK